jgi:hypothetical protein
MARLQYRRCYPDGSKGDWRLLLPEQRAISAHGVSCVEFREAPARTDAETLDRLRVYVKGWPSCKTDFAEGVRSILDGDF